MPSVREQVLSDILATLTSTVGPSPGNGTFARLGRGSPVGQAITQRPALFLVELGERPFASQIEETEVNWLYFGVLILGTTQAGFETQPAQLNDLSAKVQAVVESTEFAGTKSIAHAVGRDEPQANQSLPQGSTMPMYRVRYGVVRGDPYTAA
jgi:hypothetical protein